MYLPIWKDFQLKKTRCRTKYLYNLVCVKKKTHIHTLCIHTHILMYIYTHMYAHIQGFPSGLVVKNLPVKQETQFQSLGWNDPLETEMVTHSSTLAWDGVAKESDTTQRLSNNSIHTCVCVCVCARACFITYTYMCKCIVFGKIYVTFYLISRCQA